MPTVQSILDRKGSAVASVDRTASVLQAAQLMNDKRIGAVVVVSGDRAVGIFTERDVMTRVVATRKEPEKTLVADVMTSPMAVCRRDTKIVECRTIMTQRRIRHLPVVEDGKLYGLISSGDILAGEVAEQQATIEYLHEYLYGRH